jgi:hypothetical protein
LAALLIDSKDLCGDGSHFASLSTSDFAGDEFPPAELRHREASAQERVGNSRVIRSRSRAYFANAATPLISCLPAAALHSWGVFIIDRREQPIPFQEPQVRELTGVV